MYTIQEHMSGSTLSIDLGLHSIKIGYAGLDESSLWAPDLVVPLLTKFRNLPGCSVLPVISHGSKIGYHDWEDKLKILVHDFCTEDDSLSILFAVSVSLPVSAQSALLKLAMESLGCSNVYFAPHPVLSAVAHGMTNATVLDCGHSHTSLCDIRDGVVDPGSIWSYSVSGTHITDCFVKGLKKENALENKMSLLEDINNFEFGVEGQIVRNIKQSTLFLHNQKDIQAIPTEQINFELPDKSFITVGKSRYNAPERLFSKENIYVSHNFGDQYSNKKGNIVDMFTNALQNKKRLNAAIDLVFAGGTSMIKGFDKRFGKELRNTLSDAGCKRSIISIQTPVRRKPRKFSAWAGGAILGGMSTMSPLWITSGDYEELGADSLSKRLFH